MLGLVILGMSALHRLSALAPVMLIGGAAWVLFISLINALVQNLAPDWVRARVLAIFILVYQGSFALGSAAWGAVSSMIQASGLLLCWPGLGTIGSTVLALFMAKLPPRPSDLSPWSHLRMPIVVEEVRGDLEQGPVLVSVEYTVLREHETEFVKAMHQYARVRRRDGAYRWGIYRNTGGSEPLS